MEVRGINDFRPAFINPDFFQYSLTDGAVPVPAGIIVEFHVSAFAALTDIDPKPAGLAGKDCTGGFPLFRRLNLLGETVIVIGIQPDFLNRKVTQRNHLPSSQKERRHACPGRKQDGYRSYDKLVINGIMTSKYLWKEKSSCLYNYGFLYSFSLHNNRYFLM